ncbi:KPNA5_6 [Mytilus edulis]|uniref:KPNA5_6 n=1 Tax=Mytilus edulis TaxID=6550 RepID=A0A8S3U7L0_MYTED|nr:KPNA5_6 [Mytilus edulis]
MIQGQVISALLPHFIYHPDNVNILSEVSWVFTYLASSGEFSEEIVKNGVLTQIVVLLIQLSEVVTPLLRCLGNLCSGPDEYTVMACENQQLLPVLGTYLSSNHRHVKKETLWVLSNLTSESKACSAVTHSPLLHQILEQVPAAFDIKMEALYVLCNLAIHGEEICSYLVDNGVLQQVTPVLKSSDVEILNLGLSLVEMALRMTQNGCHVFEECDGVTRLEALDYHNNDTIRHQASELLDVYFYGESQTPIRQRGINKTPIYSLNRICNISSANIMLSDDFNSGNIDWSNSSVIPSKPDPSLHQHLLDIILQEHNLTKVIDKPTRNDSTLDLLCMSNQSLVNSRNIATTRRP